MSWFHKISFRWLNIALLPWCSRVGRIIHPRFQIWETRCAYLLWGMLGCYFNLPNNCLWLCLRGKNNPSTFLNLRDPVCLSIRRNYRIGCYFQNLYSEGFGYFNLLSICLMRETSTYKFMCDFFLINLVEITCRLTCCMDCLAFI